MASESAPETPRPETSLPETLVHPETLMAELGIKKDAYYEDLKFLKGLGLAIRTQRDQEKRTLLEPESAALIRELRAHVVTTGQRQGFRGQAVVAARPAELAKEAPPASAANGAANGAGSGAEALIRRAQELASQRLMTMDLVVAELAEQMTLADLSPAQQAQVQQVQGAVYPKADPAQIATQLLQQHRQQRGGNSQVA